MHGSALYSAAGFGETELVAALLSKGANPNFVDRGITLGATPLIIAAAGGHHDVVKLLVKAGSNLDTVTKWEGQSALHFAVQVEAYDMAEYLLRNGAAPNLQAVDGRTPLLLAAYLSNAKMVKLLLDHDADPSSKMNSGRSALELTTDRRTLKVLLEATQ